MFSLTPADAPDPASFRARIQAETLGPFTLTDVQTPYRRLLRTRADVARDTARRFGLVRVPTATEHNARPTHAREEQLRLAPGDLVISSSEWTFDTAAASGAWSSMLLIAEEQLSPLLAGGRLTRPLAIPAASPIGALLAAGFAAAMEHAPRLPSEQGEVVLRNLCGLVAIACGASDAGRASAQLSVREIRLAAARRHVDDNLARPGLSPALSAAALGISLRQMHLLFEPTGESFSQYVTRRRLEECRAALTNPADARRSVVDIAYGWGFDSLSTFYRAFHREFGIAPGEFRAAVLAATREHGIAHAAE